jgi:ribonuclease HI
MEMISQQILEAIAALDEAQRRDLFARLREIYAEAERLPAPAFTAYSPWDGQVDYLVVFDGGSRGNPGAGYGSYAIFDDKGAGYTTRLTFDSGPLTNNEAEYHTLLAALRELQQRLGRRVSGTTLKVLGDSQLVIYQVGGQWQAKDERMHSLRDEVRAELGKFKGYRLGHQPREATVQMLGH